MRARRAISNLIIQFIVLLTFGVACPLLGIVILIVMVLNILYSQLLIGRIHELDRDATIIPAASLGLQADRDAILNPTHGGISESETTASPARREEGEEEKASKAESGRGWVESSTSPLPQPIITPNLTILENLDAKNAWQGPFISGGIVVVTVSMFWASLFFDMIADGYGWVNGLITSCLFGSLFPLGVVGMYYGIPSSAMPVKLYEKWIRSKVGFALASEDGVETSPDVERIVSGLPIEMTHMKNSSADTDENDLGSDCKI